TCFPFDENSHHTYEWFASAISMVGFPAGPVRDEDIDTLSRCPYLSVVNFEGSELTDEQVGRLADAWQRGGLMHLGVVGLNSTTITNKAMPDLARMESIAFLELDGTSIDETGLNEIAKLPALEALRLPRVS